MPKTNRRLQKRLAVSAQAKIYRLDKDTTHSLNVYLLETKDINQKGLFLRTPNVFPINTMLKLALTLKPQKRTLLVEGKVARIAKKSEVGYYPGMGIKITKIERGQAKILRDFLKQKFLNYRHAVILKKMYMQLKNMAAQLYDLEQSHQHAEHFKNIIDHAIKEIDNIAHILDKEVWEVKSL